MNPVPLDERQIRLLLECERLVEEAMKRLHLAHLESINGNRMLETLANARQGLGGFLKRPY